MHTTNYFNTFIEIAEDCPTSEGEIPPMQPDGVADIYTKQYLHIGEEHFFEASSRYDPAIEIKSEWIALSICADIDHAQHASKARANNCSLCLASLFYTLEGMDKAHALLEGYAKKYSFDVLMSNYWGRHWGLHSGGRSGFWDRKGKKLGELDASTQGLLIVEKKEPDWHVAVIE